MIFSYVQPFNEKMLKQLVKIWKIIKSIQVIFHNFQLMI